MSKKNGKQIHYGRLVKSEADDIALAQAVEDRFIQLTKMWLNVTNNPLVPPESMNKDVIHWRMMRVRHQRGDFRHSDTEMKSTKTIAQWTLDMKNQLCGKPTENLNWG